NTIISNSFTNTGRNPVCEIFYGSLPTTQYPNGFSRFIFNLDLDLLKSKIFDGTISTGCTDTLSHVLKLTNTSTFDKELLNTRTSQSRLRATSFDLILFRIPYIDEEQTQPQVWDEGVGYDFADLKYEIDYNDKNFSNRPSNWYQTTTIGTWEQSGIYNNLNLGPTPFSALTIVDIQHFEFGDENIEFDKPITDVKSISKDVNDQREKSLENWNENKVVVKNSSSKVENSVKELEKKFFSETGEAQKRAKIIEETQKLKDEKKSTISKKNTTEPEIKGGAKSFAGNVMVEWELTGRSPHQNNNWYVRNPGYTCGQGADGIVVVKIRVAASGNVIGVTYVPNMSSSANPCMIEQAKKYAAMSRFMFSADAPPSQEGTIKYTFVSQ
ncbi:MAG: hypothetical protein EB100_05860, partial [Crocinitomicaceae bacterium]|nr:hypothetical protein [Crocinitomicaceae bacterium]